jgi:hypothetical protein
MLLKAFAFKQVSRGDKLIGNSNLFPSLLFPSFSANGFIFEIMRKLVFVALVAWVATGSWAQSNKEAKPETLLRWSFAGTKALGENKDLKVFNSIRSLPESAAMRDAIATNLAHAVASRYGAGAASNGPARVKIPGGAPEAMPMVAGIAALIQPLILDLVQHESRFRMDTRGAEDADWFLAVKLPKDRVNVWSKHLAQFATLSRMTGAAEDKSSWIASRESYKLAFSQLKDWTILEGGFVDQSSKPSKTFRDSLSKRLGKSVLDAEINAPLLGRIWSAPGLEHYPKLTLKAEPRRDGFHSELLLDYPQDLGIKPEKWNVPTEMIHDPLIGFTAIQGIQKKLASIEKFKALGAQQTPNQLFAWSQGISPFSVLFAADVKNPAQVVTNSSRALRDVKLPGGTLELATNRTALLWLGLPIAVPYIEPAPAPHSSFLTAGLFPVRLHQPKPAPKELFAQLDQKNLVYYDWEITSERIQQWIPIWQLNYLVRGEYAPDNSAPSPKFLQTLRTNVANTITVGTLENPKRIKFTRQSQLGASALELVLLSHYLDTADLRPIRGRRGTPALPAVPAP